MARLEWDKEGQRLYETGVSNGTLYVKEGTSYGKGVAWNGLTAVTESPSGAESTPLYADNIKYLNLLSAEEFGATVEAYTYPEEFEQCDGTASLVRGVNIGQQSRKPFGLVYKTLLGNDAEGTAYGYKLHIIYNAQAAPSEKAYATVNDSPEAITFSWELTTTPVNVSGKQPTACVTIDSTKVDAEKLALLENKLFGTESSDPTLVTPDEIGAIFKEELPEAIKLTESAPANANAALAVNGTIILTFNNPIAKENVTMMKADGTGAVEITKTFDGANKKLTIKPKTNLSNSTKYFVVISGVTDVYAQTLATTINNYTTVAQAAG